MEGRDYALASEHGVTEVDWHAHIYFNADQAEEARLLGEAMRQIFGVAMGRVHSTPVGPHPRGSCQLTIPHPMIGDALLWLVRNRGEFTVFVHANTGDDWQDHTAHVVWLGASEQLNLGCFSKSEPG
jgi:DOPA 4,5-dioxygenase